MNLNELVNEQTNELISHPVHDHTYTKTTLQSKSYDILFSEEFDSLV